MKHPFWNILCAVSFPFLPAVVFADDLQPLGDEFDDSASIAQWRDIQQVEGWGSNQLEEWNINTATPGMMRVTPRTSSWYNHLRGALVFKDVTGDFVCTMRLRVRSRHNAGNPDEVPNRMYTLAGIFAHVPRGANYHGAPDPYTSDAFAPQGGAPVWPYPGSGSSWQPFTENYLFLSFGAANQPGVRKYEVKATRNSSSLLYYNNLSYGGAAIPNTADYTWVELQMVRVGQRVVVLRRHPDGAGGWGAWIVENRYPNSYQNQFPLTGAAVQLGITTYTDWESIQNAYFIGDGTQNDHLRQWRHNYTTLQTGQNLYGGAAHAPDLVTDVDYFRLERPNVAVTEASLDALPTTFVNLGSQSLQLLPANGAGQYLGDAANTPLGGVSFSTPSFSVNERDGVGTISVTRSGASQDRALSVNYSVTAGTATAGADFTAVSGTLTWAANDPATKMLMIPIISNDGLAEEDETATITLTGLNGPATFPASAPSLVATLTIHDSLYDAWRLAQFGANANGPDAQPEADADHDGLTTLAEFALNTSPLTPDALPSAAAVSGGRLTLTFPRNLASDTVTYVVQGADAAGGAWYDIATRPPGGPWNSVPGVTVNDGPTVMVTDAIDVATTPRRFLRLRLLMP
jgi:hypothetical protein